MEDEPKKKSQDVIHSEANFLDAPPTLRHLLLIVAHAVDALNRGRFKKDEQPGAIYDELKDDLINTIDLAVETDRKMSGPGLAATKGFPFAIFHSRRKAE